MPDYSLKRSNQLQEQQAPSPIAQLSQASQQAKLETENALLREALATSAQNCEALMNQSNQSLEKINQIIAQWIDWIKKEHHQTNQQLLQLKSMNESFSKNLSDVLTHTNGKLAAQLKTEVSTAIKANIQAMENTVKSMEQTVASVTGYEKELKITLDKRIKAYNASIRQLFKLDDWRDLFFWAGTAGGILTPIVLIISHFI